MQGAAVVTLTPAVWLPGSCWQRSKGHSPHVQRSQPHRGWTHQNLRKKQRRRGEDTQERTVRDAEAAAPSSWRQSREKSQECTDGWVRHQQRLYSRAESWTVVLHKMCQVSSLRCPWVNHWNPNCSERVGQNTTLCSKIFDNFPL